MHSNDLQLTKEDIGQLENVEQIIHFFARLGYDVDDAIPLDHAALGMDSEDLRQQIRHIHRIAGDPGDDLIVYFLQLRSVTVSLTHTLARRFRERVEDALLVLTADFESLDFVLIDKELTRGKTRAKAFAQIIRPRSLTIKRRDPAPVALRTLKRFTFTEADALYQWDKLRAAYDVAEWAEPEFNNRALFSDYYLKNRLTETRLTPEWGEDVRPIGRKLHQHLSNARQTYTRQPEQTIRAGLYEPLFRELGFEFVVNKPGTADTEEADYLLYSPGDRSQPLAVVLTYVWNRNLDNDDTSRDPDTAAEIPGALVVSVLEKNAAPWVIVTNGKLWRLYSTTASNKATNYYEIDLEEALAAPDQVTALKYWWLFFRRQAFTGFLDALLQQSADYAKALGDRLKDRVFTEIFPHFAAGFIGHIRTQAEQPQADFSEESLQIVYEGTLTFLYRLMFVLYAESLELLPLYEMRGYRELSLYKMKGELKECAGEILDEAPEKLRRQYAANSTALYDRLTELFTVIDEGSESLNLPTYNGGLFSRTNENGEFLAAYKISDRYLALGLDRLCRDVDDKTQALAFIDYKSLGVRQLGSIYEGLLEFKLRIAQEELAVVKGQYVAAASLPRSDKRGDKRGKDAAATEVKRDGKDAAATGVKRRGKDAGVTVPKDAVYLENDKKERKATGSYYTPDYIVKYIVTHTVGPVLARKFTELTPRLRQAQKAYRDHAKKVQARGNDQPADLFWNNADMRQLADDCLNVRVLDPAMGSGHFLVEVVDFVSNRLIDFLNGWSDNPVWALLNRTRDDILGEMERQKVTIDIDRLTRVALLKRAVLKRCIYGVDLNLMAVELAKVSLWLDAFTLGAPLSFLDHHLKQGNSLIGARIEEVKIALKAKPGQQMSLLAQSKFTGMMLATDLMRQVSYLSDNTVSQVAESQQAYRDARDHLAPYKRVLDVYTSRWFGNEPSKKGFEPVLEFLQRDDTQAWLEKPDSAKLPAKDYMNVRDVAEKARQAAEEKCFFHWELEFPEVFFAPSQPGGQDVQLQKDGGFDAVVGNPPYDELSEEALGRVVDERDFLTKATLFSPTQDSSGRLNWYHYFMVIALQLLTSNGRNGLIVPMSWMGDSFTFGVRKWMLDNHRPTLIEAFPQKDNPFERVFFDAKLPTTIFVAEKNRRLGCISIRVHPGKDILQTMHFEADPDVIRSLSPDNLLIPLVDHSGWKILEVLGSSKKLGRLADIAAEPTSGEIIFNAATRPYMSRKQKPGYELILRGSHVQRYEIVEKAKQGEPEYLNVKAYLENSRENSKAYAHKTDRIVYQEGSAIDAWRRIVPSYLPEGYICGHKICYFVDYKINKFALLAIFASNLSNWLVEKLSVTNSLPAYLIGNLPFPRIDLITPTDEREEFVGRIVDICSNDDKTGAFAQVQLALSANQSDVVHDVLAHLAQTMLDLNQKKQAEVRRFLGWLEGRLKITPKNSAGGLDSLSSKTILQGYLGDYQKGERETSWEDFYYRLHQNRNRFAANLAQLKPQIEQEYEKSLAVLRPIKRQLADTDALIDQIVYKLYGLSDEEIELIERPAYEQALSDAKAKVVKDKELQKDPEAAADVIAQTILPAAQRLQSRLPHQAERERLTQELPGWETLPGDAPTFLLSGEYDLATRPGQLDFSSAVISFAKAVESSLYNRLFIPFREKSGYTDADCRNKFLQEFMRGERHLTLGSFPIIMASSRETALRQFAATQFASAETALFSQSGVLGLLQDDANITLRNKAAHDEVLSKEDARNGREWALNILRHL